MRKSIIYELKATMRDFVTFEKLSVNNIHFGFNQSNSYYLMGKNNSVNGEVMFKFDASKYDIKDGNVTFWIWSPDIPSLGSVPIPASSTKGSAQSQTGNAPKLGYSSAKQLSDSYYYTTTAPAYKSPHIELKVTESKAFQIAITAKFLDSYDNPVSNIELLVKITLYPPNPSTEKQKGWTTTKTYPWGNSTDDSSLFRSEVELRTNDKGEIGFCPILNIPPYIKFAKLHVEVLLNQYWNGYPKHSIRASSLVLVGKWVTILTDNIDNILNLHSLKFRRTTEKVEKIDDLTITTYRYFAEINKFDIIINFKMKLSPNYTKTNIEETRFNFIMDLDNRSDKDAVFVKILNKRLMDDLRYYILNETIVKNDRTFIDIANMNAHYRVYFKWKWQLSYLEWSFGDVKIAYKKVILNSKGWSYSSTSKASTNDDKITDDNLNAFLWIYTSKLKNQLKRDPYYTPNFLYSMTLSTGDYRYILAAILGSMFTIVNSLGLGLNEAKSAIIKYLEEEKENEKLMYKSLIGLLVSLPGGVISKIVEEIFFWLAFLTELSLQFVEDYVTEFIYQLVVESSLKAKYTYLRENAFASLKLLRLIEIINYDLSLLNFEIKVWDQLSDGTKWGGGKPTYYYY
jgi:hypothetical protein